jgi:hypothetical protein
MNFTPTNVFLSKDSSGNTVRTEQWDYSSLAIWEGSANIGVFLALSFLAIFISPIIAVISIVSFRGPFSLANILAVIFSAFVLYDASYGGFYSLIMSLFVEEYWMNVFIILNAASLVVNAYLIVFGIPTHRFIVDNVSEPVRRLVFGIIMITIISIASIKTLYLLNDNKGWFERNVSSSIAEDAAERQAGMDAMYEENRKIYEEQRRKDGY